MIAPSTRELHIEAGSANRTYWEDLWTFRDLALMLAWRDILARYKQAVFGVAWAWLRPLMTMVVFTLVFGGLAKLPSGDVPYPVMVFVALLPWQFFSTAFSAASASLIDNSNLISKVYFPRLLVPISSVVVSFVDFLVTVVLLMLLMVWYQIIPDWHIVFLPVFMGLAALLALGCGFFVAALNVKYRDFRFVVPFIVQLGVYVSPIGFSTSVVPERWRTLFELNPLVGIIDGFRWCLLGGQVALDPVEILASGVAGVTAIIIGIAYFRKTELLFADMI